MPSVKKKTNGRMERDSMASKPGVGERAIGVLANARIMYLCYYMALGAFLPFIALYYERMGLTGVQIGTLSALPMVVTSITSLLWGTVVDALHLHRRILSVALFLAPIAVFMLSQTAHYTILIPIVLTYAFFSAPIIPLLDSAALEVVEARQRTYGELRVWGAIGWTVSTWLVGTLIQKFNTRWLFYSYVAFMGLTFIVSLSQPARRHVLRSTLHYGLRRLLVHRALLFFLLSIFFLATAMGAVNYFFSLYLDGIGASEGTIGLAWALAALSEVPVMIYSGSIMDHIGAKGLLRVAFITFAVRWLLYSFITTPAWVLLVQLLHGLSFAAFLVGGVTYINDRTPEGLSTTGQAIFNTVSFAMGPIAGALVGGYFYDTVGMMALFRILSLLTVTGLGVFWLANEPQANEDMILNESQG
jgi:PPP family 3-phenylpropionic acid transporter